MAFVIGFLVFCYGILNFQDDLSWAIAALLGFAPRVEFEKYQGTCRTTEKLLKGFLRSEIICQIIYIASKNLIFQFGKTNPAQKPMPRPHTPARRPRKIQCQALTPLAQHSSTHPAQHHPRNATRARNATRPRNPRNATHATSAHHSPT